MSLSVFDAIPLPLLFLGTLLIVLASIETGHFLGRRAARAAAHGSSEFVGSIAAATLGLLAFILAFTFGMAGSRFDARRQLVLDEANAIGTTYLRAALLPEPHAAEVRRLLREYVDVRLEALHAGDVARAIARSEELHGRLWSHATAVGQAYPESITGGLFIASLNEVIDLHQKRVTVGMQNRIPPAIWAALYVLSALAMFAVGYHAAASSPRRSLGLPVLALAFSTIVVLIVALDRPRQGLVAVSQQALVDTRRGMNDAEPSRGGEAP